MSAPANICYLLKVPTLTALLIWAAFLHAAIRYSSAHQSFADSPVDPDFPLPGLCSYLRKKKVASVAHYAIAAHTLTTSNFADWFELRADALRINVQTSTSATFIRRSGDTQEVECHPPEVRRLAAPPICEICHRCNRLAVQVHDIRGAGLSIVAALLAVPKCPY